MKNLFGFFTIALLGICSTGLYSQGANLPAPRVSPQASVNQTIGLTEISINYSRPAVRDREVWGNLVPMDAVWRTGANENTTISFSNDVSINGNTLTAGTYGLHTIPSETDWTIVFSNNNHLWGSFRYDEAEDALRIKTRPSAAQPQEYLQISFPEVSNNSATVEISWAGKKFGFKIDVDVHEAVIAEYRRQIRGLQGFFPASLSNAARYCLTNNTHIDEGLTWIDLALARQNNFGNTSIKALLLEQKGDSEGSKKLIAETIESATEAEINTYGYQLMGAGRTDEALKIFKRNTKNFPDSWNTYDSLAEAYQRSGNNKEAIKLYRKAMGMVQDPNQRNRIANILSGLERS